jgi:hypothetical protein
LHNSKIIPTYPHTACAANPPRSFTFRNFELQTQAFKAALLPTLLEQRARLTDSPEALGQPTGLRLGHNQKRAA